MNRCHSDNAGNRLTNTVSTQPLNTDGSPQVNTDGTPVLTSRAETYGYDEINRLTSVAYGDGSIQEYPFWTGRVHLRTRA